MEWIRPILVVAVLLLILSAAASHGAESPDGVWFDIDEAALQLRGERLIVPQRYRTVRLDWAGLGAVLQTAPLEGSPAALSVETLLTLPLPDGDFALFRIEESPIMVPELAAQLPEVKTYRGVGVDDPTAVVRFDHTPAGFHALIRSTSGTIFIDPYARGETGVYISYDTRDFARPEGKTFECGVGSEDLSLPTVLAPAPSPAIEEPVPNVTSNGATLRQIGLAVAATGEYTAFHGGTKTGAYSGAL